MLLRRVLRVERKPTGSSIVKDAGVTIHLSSVDLYLIFETSNGNDKTDNYKYMEPNNNWLIKMVLIKNLNTRLDTTRSTKEMANIARYYLIWKRCTMMPINLF